jgi:hypothetical protein
MNLTGIAEFILRPDPVAPLILRAGRALEYSRAGDDDGDAAYFFFAPVRLIFLIASGGRPDFSAISRSCSRI